MGDFVDGFLRTASTKKLNQNHRDMQDMAKGIGAVVAQAVVQQKRINEEAATNRELREEVRRLQKRVLDLEMSVDVREAHRIADSVRTRFLMLTLDRVCDDQGIENPAKKQAYEDADALRIPSGDRKGEVVTMADHAYIQAFANVFEEHFAEKWTHIKGWREFLHHKISY